MSVASKRCCRCDEDKPVTEFRPNRGNADGLYSWCQPCAKAYRRAQYQRNKARELQLHREWVARNKERWGEYMRQWRGANPERIAEHRRREHDRHAADRSARHRAARTAQRGAPFTESGTEFAAILIADRFCCYCGSPRYLGIDHIVPISVGGASDWDNLTACCAGCNASKRSRPLLDFLAQRAAAA